MTLAFRLPPCPDSPLRRLDPRWKLAALGLATVATALPRTLPAAAVALACALFLAGLARLRVALRVRGYRNRATRHSYRTIGHVAGTLLVRSHERGERVSQAMRCRGFDGGFRSLTTFRTAPKDVIFFSLLAAGSAGLVFWDLHLRG